MNEWGRVGLVFVGAGLGGSTRYLIQVFTNRHWPSFPWGTLGINVVGSLLIGIYFGWEARHPDAQAWRFLVPTGLLGGFTTFSAFSAETLKLWNSGSATGALAYAGGSVLLSIGACGLGLMLMK